jgi:hypothetical protein
MWEALFYNKPPREKLDSWKYHSHHSGTAVLPISALNFKTVELDPQCFLNTF